MLCSIQQKIGRMEKSELYRSPVSIITYLSCSKPTGMSVEVITGIEDGC